MIINDFWPQWLQSPAISRLIAIYREERAEIAFVGGAMRDHIAGNKPVDFDIVASLSMMDSYHLLESKGYAPYIVSRTHNTIRAVIEGTQFDIMAMDRHSLKDKPFARSVSEHVGQFDFTINTPYLLTNGQLHDHFDGIEDAQKGRIRFTYEPAQSVRDNPMHILRFFRFQAMYGKTRPDAQGLVACSQHIGLIKSLRSQRVRNEMLKLLSVPSCYATLRMMHERDILTAIFGFSIADCAFIEGLETIEKITYEPPEPHLRLVLLLLKADIEPQKAWEQLAVKWDIAEKYHQQLKVLLQPMEYIDPKSGITVQEQLIGRLGTHAYKDMVLLLWAMEKDVIAARSRYQPMLPM